MKKVKFSTTHKYFFVPSRQEINAVSGRKRAAQIQTGDSLWTLNDGNAEKTTVKEIHTRQTRRLVKITTTKGSFVVAPDFPFFTQKGLIEAQNLQGQFIEWTFARSLCRNRFEPKLNYDFGYALGAIFSDGSVVKNAVSFVVNEKHFAESYSLTLENAFGIKTNLEAVERPSGFLNRMVGGWRVRVVSSYFSDLIRMYAGGDANHLTQSFPRVVLHSLETFKGFIDGYVEGDGCRSKYSKGAVIVSANIPFLLDFSMIVGARFTPRPDMNASKLYIADSWFKKRGFIAESHRTTLQESEFIEVLKVENITSDGCKPFTLYSFKCEPYPTFLKHGHL